jgi:nucleoside-diphosphate-sugar epimerase
MYNAGNGGRFSLNDVWDRVQKVEGVQIAAKYGPPRAGDVRDSMADTARAVAELGHAPRFSIEDGLKRTLEWYRQTI